MPTKKKKTPEWELASESLNLGDGRWGYTDKVRTHDPAWDWYAEGGPLGAVEGRARTAEQARQRIENALGFTTHRTLRAAKRKGE